MQVGDQVVNGNCRLSLQIAVIIGHRFATVFASFVVIDNVVDVINQEVTNQLLSLLFQRVTLAFIFSIKIVVTRIIIQVLQF